MEKSESTPARATHAGPMQGLYYFQQLANAELQPHWSSELGSRSKVARETVENSLSIVFDLFFLI